MPDTPVDSGSPEYVAPYAVPVVPAATPGIRKIDIIRRASAAGRRKIVIAEWEGMDLWFGQLVVDDLRALGENEPGSILERNLQLLVLKAENEDGTPAFYAGDLHFLRSEAALKVLNAVIDFMMEAAVNLPTATEEADRIAADPPSVFG